MAIIFIEDGHKYQSVEEDHIDWVSATKLFGKLKNPFDKKKISESSSKKSTSKWFGLDPQRIRDIWDAETLRSTTMGSLYHAQEESMYAQHEHINHAGHALPVINPIIEDGIKYAPAQRLLPGIYPEHLCYLKSEGVIGQTDMAVVYDYLLHIGDHKTNKKIERESYVNWEGISKKMLGPLSHLDDCNFIHYALQLSLYAYIILKHNPRLKLGSLQICHVEFEVEGYDEWEYPINKLDAQGNPIVKSKTYIDVPYLKDEVIQVLKYKKENPHLFV